ncbi:CopG family transcriptional regulator [Aliarcobacter butzleri]|uniref:ribbon-helix-helix domain-containing protein n=1 Tax=Aliarcobacter butzleri TaxID=28197 RepID=UPI0021B41816|nr:CopG family transcriptional regulator [Aliarcobacter butzleri]MCT7609811.1 ribbon-helix-helix domain-containing protein [Aliarcobacter butzleri]
MSENSVGRPKEENPRNVQLKIKVTEEEARRIEELAEKMGMNKSRLIRNLLLGNLDDAEFLQKIYVLPIAKRIFEWSDKVRGKI